MTDAPYPVRPPSLGQKAEGVSARFARWRNEKIANPAFQRWASRFPLTRRVSRKAAEEVYDLVSGFVYSQTLLACVELDLLERARVDAFLPAALAREVGVEAERLTILCQAAASLDLLTRQRDGRYGLGRVGAAVLGVPGLALMIRHHSMFYRDLADPSALLRGETDPMLAQYWPYVGGKRTHDLPADVAKTYSELMATSQHLVAQETLDAFALSGRSHLLDIGGGTGAFLSAVAERYADLRLTLFDLPAVAEEGQRLLSAKGLETRIETVGGSFLDGGLPREADTISLVRVLYDHNDETVRALLAAVFEALPAGGKVLISEPMSGGAKPSKAGDAYFGFYTMAMTTGRPRSAERHGELLREAGFSAIRGHRTATPFITGVLSAEKSMQ